MCLHGNDSVSPIRIEGALQFLFKDELGFTLIGEKPVSINWCEDYELSHNKVLAEAVFGFLRMAFDKSDTHILNIVPFGPGAEIQLIHKKALSNLIIRERTLRVFVEQNYGSEESFFRSLADLKKTMHEFFHFDRELLGLVFGYGKSNAEYSFRSSLLAIYLKKYPRVYLLSFNPMPRISTINSYQRKVARFRFEAPQPRPKPLPQFKSLDEEWDWICQVNYTHRADTSPPPPYLFRLPSYRERTGGDSEEVRQKFLHARDRVANLFCGRKFSEVIAQEARKNQRTESRQDRR